MRGSGEKSQPPGGGSRVGRKGEERGEVGGVGALMGEAEGSRAWGRRSGDRAVAGKARAVGG
jgi:hypothetical protein